MKLYFATGTCALSPHIALLEAGLPFDAEKVDLQTKKTADGADYNAINPKGYVPALVLDNGEVLTEGPAIVQYVADQVPERGLAPPPGSFERYRLAEWLNFISTEIHKTFSGFFKPDVPEETRQGLLAQLGKRFDHADRQLQGREYLMGDFTVADGYLFTVLAWTRPLKIDLSRWPNLQAYLQRVGARPAVHAAMVAEGLIKG
ncbi:glutathione transferase GstA [Noviherbaspirillum aridicola]|uniref:Glutathione S-transferase n=1 Tax=Noviherbaspirillum aridicola TaxID=2849687 RepID=A0ABQ4Q607_9BURK|nr:glutathione transferase GstA [Noviherbaspirillum aridicola]GIZ52235.1 glutathione S-transferase [Noviherbaspirillum aridicola]